MNNYFFINNSLRIVSALIVLISQFYIFPNSQFDFYSFLLIGITFLWNIFFAFFKKSSNLVLIGSIIDIILGAFLLYISKNPFGILLSFVIPTVSGIQFLSSHLRYILVFISFIGTIIGLLSIFALFSDPVFQNLVSLLIANIMISILIIAIFLMFNRIVDNLKYQFENYREQNELLVSNINELENKIVDYEKQVEFLKNEIEQERIAFNIEMEKVIKEFQMRKDETYTQLKALNNELILKDKAIQELSNNVKNIMLDVDELRNELNLVKDVLNFLAENIDDFQSLYKISEDVIEVASRFFYYDTLVIFIKNEIDGNLDVFLVSGENSEFYYNYKKIEMEELYKLTFIEGKIVIASKENDSLIRPFYPKEVIAVSIPLSVAKSRIGMIYISYLDEEKYKPIKEDLLIYLSNIIGIMLFSSIFYSKSINRVIWDDRLFCYSADFIWEFINNLSFSSKRYNESFGLLFISFSQIFGKNINDLNDNDVKFIREINITIKSVVRETDMVSFIGNGVIVVVLTKVDKDKVEVVCNRIKNMIDSKLNLLGFIGESYLLCSIYPYKSLEISQFIELSIEKLSNNIGQRRVVLEVVKA